MPAMALSDTQPVGSFSPNTKDVIVEKTLNDPYWARPWAEYWIDCGLDAHLWRGGQQTFVSMRPCGQPCRMTTT